MAREVALQSDAPTIDEQRRFWDWHWQNWRERKAISDWAIMSGERVLSLLSSLALAHPRILDLGCGNGWFSQELSKFGAVTGIDLSEDAIAKAQASYPHITFLAGNVLTASLPSGSFDVVVSKEVFAHVDDQVRFLDVAANALRPGGYLILTTANKFVLDRLGTSTWAWPREHVERFVDLKRLRHLLAARFRVLRTMTALPMGNAGMLRIINSGKVNKALSLVIPERVLTGLKERAGLGYCLIALGQLKGVEP